jgi:hypothetical protein
MQIKLPAGWQPHNPAFSGDYTPDWEYIRWCLSGTIMFYLASSLFVYSASDFADFDTRKHPITN